MYTKQFLLTKWALYAISFILLGILFFSPMDPNVHSVYAATVAVDCTDTTVTEIPQDECEALVALYNNADGPNWTDNTGWLDDAIKPCEWYGVTCSGGNITELDLSGESSSAPFGLQGDLPSEIGNLANLTRLNLDNNQLNSLPAEIGDLNNLDRLYLRFNLLNSLPAEIGNLNNLTELYLNFNQLNSLPDTIDKLTSLNKLVLQGNPLGSLPAEFWSLTSLISLNLYGIGLSSLPPEIGNLKNLRGLDISNNQLSSLPPEFWTLTNLAAISLWNNQLTTLPPEVGKLTNLTNHFHLHMNELTSLPPEIGNLTKLTNIQLSRNQLTSLPKEIGNLSELTGLALHSNQLSDLPIEITNLISLTNLSLAYNRLVISDGKLRVFVNKLYPDWEKTQTIAPIGVTAIATGTESIELTWTPIPFQDHGGFYEISVSDGITFTVHGTTTNKSESRYIIDDITSGTADNFRIRTYTPYHNGSPDEAWDNFTQAIWSDYSYATSITESHEIQGNVWSDANANGLRDADELGKTGVIVKIQSYIDCNISRITTTDDSGEYTFTGLDPSLNYFVTFEAPDGTIFSPQDVGGDDTIDSDVHPNTGQINFDGIPSSGVDAGIIDPPNSGTGGIASKVYQNDNGGKIGICGVTVELKDLYDNVLATSLTDVDGNYDFIDLEPDAYKVQFIEPEDAIFSLDNLTIDPKTGAVGPFDIGAGEIKDLSVNVVPYSGTLDCTGKGKEINIPGFIEGRVWNDVNRDGLNNDDSYDPGVIIVCKCEDKDGREVEVATNESGHYQIKILRAPKKYTIRIQPPHNKILTKPGNSSVRDLIYTIEPELLHENNNYSIDKIDVGLLLLGDVNCNGKSNSDALLVMRYDGGILRGSDQCPPEGGAIYLPACDVNDDNKCDTIDAKMIGPSGDVNCDGKTDHHDTSLIRLYSKFNSTIIGSDQCLPEQNTIYLPACDVNHDGKCDEIDAEIIDPSGDVNCDGKADSIDFLFILQFDIGSRKGSDQCPPEEGTLYLPACDVNGDGECGAIDALFISQCEIGIESPFCPAARTFDNEENTKDQMLQVTDSALQQNSATLRMKYSKQVNIGETFTVIVEVESEAKIGAVKASVDFDTTQFKYEGCQDLEHEDIFFGGCNLSRKDGEDNRIIFNAIMPKGASGLLTLAKINLTHIGPTMNMGGFNLKKHTCADNGGIPLPCTIGKNHELFLPVIH